MRPSAPFIDADFQSLDAFRMKWRWTEAQYNILPQEALAAIRPFTPRMAEQLWAWSDAFLDLSKAPGELALSDGAFSSVRRLDTSAKDAQVRHWLEETGVQHDFWVIVSWQPDLAILTRWDVFIGYWDDFCYPSAYDVLIWPASEEWALLYWHEEELIFGTQSIESIAEQPAT